ncbi:MAG: hypothetical protein ABR987_03240 [Terracidiphilus sp.]|jgi:hypothetical protein
MSCEIDVATELKQDILDLDRPTRRQIRAFLLALQENPLLEGRKEMGDAAFYIQLPCGVYISWEIVGNIDILKMVLTGKTKGMVVRILGVSNAEPG